MAEYANMVHGVLRLLSGGRPREFVGTCDSQCQNNGRKRNQGSIKTSQLSGGSVLPAVPRLCNRVGHHQSLHSSDDPQLCTRK